MISEGHQFSVFLLISLPINPFTFISLCVCMRVKLLQLYLTLCNPTDYNLPQAPLSMKFSSQDYWSGLSFPPPVHRMIGRNKNFKKLYVESTKTTQERTRCNMYVS